MKNYLFFILVFVLLAAGCGSEPEPAPTPTITPPPLPPAEEPGEEPTGDYAYGEAPVSDVRLVVMESFPIQVDAMVSGELPDGCTEIHDWEQRVEEQEILITLTTRRPMDMACTEALVPYGETVPVDVVGLEAGEYIVRVNGVAADQPLVLDVDNVILPSEPGLLGTDSCPSSTTGSTAFLSEEGGYCLLYPGGYEIQTPAQNITLISAPAMADDADVRPTLGIQLEAADGPTLQGGSLQDLADRLIEQFSDVDPTYVPMFIGDHPALVFEGLPPGEGRDRQAYVLVSDRLYILVVQPIDGASLEAVDVAEELWTTVIDSITFIEIE